MTHPKLSPISPVARGSFFIYKTNKIGFRGDVKDYASDNKKKRERGKGQNIA